MYAVGHLALGYLSGRITSKLLKTDVNLPLLFLLSVIPDISLLASNVSRGPTHSIVVFIILFLPAFALCGKKALPYFIALCQHSLIGDCITDGGAQLLWPLTSNWYGQPIEITANIFLEWTLFLSCFTIMLQTKDFWVLFQPHPANLLLSVPDLTIVLPTFLSFPLSVPAGLIIPHLVYLIVFSVSIIIAIMTILKSARANNSLRQSSSPVQLQKQD